MKKLQMPIKSTTEGLVLIIVGLIFIPESWNSIINAHPRSYGQGYIPFFAALSLFICGLALLREAYQHRQFEGLKGIQWGKIFRGPGLSIISLIAYMEFMELLGFGLATFLLLVVLLRILKAYSWPSILILSSITAISFHYIFRVWLYLPLPLGLLFSYLFYT